jgi:hypothetical protein
MDTRLIELSPIGGVVFVRVQERRLKPLELQRLQYFSTGEEYRLDLRGLPDIVSRHPSSGALHGRGHRD